MAIFSIPNFIPVLLGKIVKKKLKQPFLAIPNLYQSFWETLSEKDWNKHFWPFLIYTSLSGKNCWKKFGTTIFGHSKFIPVFWEKLLEKIRMAIFGHSKFVPVFLRKIVGKKFKMAIFGHTKFIPVLLGNIVKKKLEHPFLAIPNLYQSFWEKLLEKKFGMAIFGHTKFIPVLLGNIVKKKIGTSIFGHS